MEHEERIATLTTQLVPVDMQDPLAEAGRKALLKQFIRMLTHEAGARTGADIEDVHQMRVATRQMRSLFATLRGAYRRKSVRRYRRALRTTARRLGTIRDLDVLVADLARFRATLAPEQGPAVDALAAIFSAKRDAAREDLVDWLDSDRYARFVGNFSKFLTTPGKGALAPDAAEIAPNQVRHIVPVILHERLAAVRAYDTVMEGIDAGTLHCLRIEFKRLRYTISFFTDVLGTAAGDFIDQIKDMQDHLGRLNDIAVARARLRGLKRPADDVAAVRDAYMADMAAEREALVAGFPELWNRFNTRTVQRKLADALLVLR